MDRGQKCMHDRIQVFVFDRGQYFQADTLMLGFVSANVVRAAINRNVVPATNKPRGEFLGKCFKAAVICRNATGSEDRDLHRLESQGYVIGVLHFRHTLTAGDATKMIDILLSTFNGEAFIKEQLDSVLAQTGSEFRVMIRDDGSTDRTVEILDQYAATDPRISIMNDGSGNLGVRRSFMSLVERSAAPYFMLCDQDDVWLPGKVRASLGRISAMREMYGDDLPLLVFTDLTVTDRDLTVIAESFWKYQSLDPDITCDWRDLLAQNVVTGSTIIANAAARRACIPFVLDEMMHDHWLAVNTARSGHIEYLTEPSVLYRQHDQNTEGARLAGSKYIAGNANKLMRRMPFFRKAATHFGGVTASELLIRKIRLNLRRFFL